MHGVNIAIDIKTITAYTKGIAKMAREARRMMFISKVPALIGELQTKENRLISQAEIADKTGLKRQTVSRWTKEGEEIGNLDPDTVHAFISFFGVTLNELVSIVEKQPEL